LKEQADEFRGTYEGLNPWQTLNAIKNEAETWDIPGYKAETVDQEMMRHSPRLTTDKERNDSFERRTRILQYAYGASGDIDIATSRLTSDQIQKFIAEAEQKDQELQNAIEQQKRLRTGDPYKAYHLHATNIKQHMPKIKDAQLDAMIALRMRSNGHSKEDITKAITRMTSVAKMTWDDQRQKHAERVADFAFGLQGTHDMMRNKSYWPMWRKVEGVQEMQQQKEEERPVWRMR